MKCLGSLTPSFALGAMGSTAQVGTIGAPESLAPGLVQAKKET